MFTKNPLHLLFRFHVVIHYNQFTLITNVHGKYNYLKDPQKQYQIIYNGLNMNSIYINGENEK